MTYKKTETAMKACKDEFSMKKQRFKDFFLLILLHADVNELKDEEH